MKPTALYIRVSSDEQARSGLSLQAQTECLHKYASDNGYDVVGEYRDEGVSAHIPYKKRPALMSLLHDVELGKVKFILIIKLDRWFRSVQEYYDVQKILDRHGAVWRTVLEDYEIESSAGKFKVNIMLSVAQAESDRTGERIKFVFDDKRSRGEVLSGNCPLGVKIVNKHYAVDEETAPIVRAIFKKYIECRSCRELSIWYLNTYRKTRTQQSMRNLLSNAKIHDLKIVDDDTWNKTQSIIESRATRKSTTGRVYLFSGLCRCAECGSVMRATIGSGKVFYGCSLHSRYKNEKCRNKHTVTEKTLEEMLITRVLQEAENWNITVKQKNTVPAADNNAAVRRKMEKLKDLYLNDLIERDTYESEYLTLKSQLIDVKPETMIDTEGLSNVLTVYQKLDPAHRKAFWSSIIKRITIDRDNNLFLEFHC